MMSQNLTLKQYKALYLLADGYAVSTVARRVGVRRETVSRWRQMDAFKTHYAEYLQVLDDELRRDRLLVRTSLLNRLQQMIESDPHMRAHDLMKLLDRFIPMPDAPGDASR
jgi:hypothetical protein